VSKHFLVVLALDGELSRLLDSELLLRTHGQMHVFVDGTGSESGACVALESMASVLNGLGLLTGEHSGAKDGVHPRYFPEPH
jgi:hypothetical protein